MDVPFFTPSILIVDDEPYARTRLKNLLSDIESLFPHRICGEADSCDIAQNLINTLKPDIVFMDINMPDGSGMGLVQKLGNTTIAFIFLTARDDCALDAFNLNAADYLLKPVKAERLMVACNKAMLSLKEKKKVPELKIIERDQIILVPLTDIYYCHSDLKYTTIKTLDSEYISNESLNSLEEKYGAWFIRIHRSTLISKSHISKLYKHTSDDDSAWVVELDTLGTAFPVSRRQLPCLKTYLNLNS